MIYCYLEIHVTLRALFIYVRPYYDFYMFDLVSPLGLGVRLESKVGGYPSDEITCWRLTPVVYIFLGCPRGIYFSHGESRPGVGDIVVETDRGSSISVTSDAHTLCILMYFRYCRSRARSCIYVRLYVFYFQCCILMIPACGTSFTQVLYVPSVYLYSVILDYIYTLFTSSYISPLCS